MSENKTGKYLKYAVGEIALVVIGILIALSINNWNENRKANALAKKYISDIKTDLVNDTLTYNSALNRLKRTIEKNKILLNPSLTSNLSIDSLQSIISTSFPSIRIYKIDNATYLKLSNTVFLDSGKYTTLFEEINTYYNKEYVSYSEHIEWDEEQTIDMFHPDFLGTNRSSVSIFDSHSDKKASRDFRNFINSNEFRNKTWANYNRKEIVVDRLLFQKRIATELIEKIDRTLEKK